MFCVFWVCLMCFIVTSALYKLYLQLLVPRVMLISVEFMWCYWGNNKAWHFVVLGLSRVSKDELVFRANTETDCAFPALVPPYFLQLPFSIWEKTNKKVRWSQEAEMLPCYALSEWARVKVQSILIGKHVFPWWLCVEDIFNFALPGK